MVTPCMAAETRDKRQVAKNNDVIENQFITVGEWNFGSAISVIMAFVMMAIMYLVRYVEKRNSGNRKEKKA